MKKEKDAKAKLDKEKRKVEADLKDTREKLGETELSLKEAKDTVVKYVLPFFPFFVNFRSASNSRYITRTRHITYMGVGLGSLLNGFVAEW